jgi:hypothetical protein
MAREGDIVLPVELCNLRRGETFKQWTARAKRCTIEAAGQDTGGTVQRVAERWEGVKTDMGIEQKPMWGKQAKHAIELTYVAGSRGSGSRRRTVDTSIRLW